MIAKANRQRWSFSDSRNEEPHKTLGEAPGGGGGLSIVNLE
jgi:hypothetical protein